MTDTTANPLGLTKQLAILGEPVKLRMIRLLEAEELSVGEVARVLQLPQSTVSRHLKALSAGGWSRRRTERTATYDRVSIDDLDEPLRSIWLAVREHVAAMPEIREDDRRLHDVLAERTADSRAFFGRVAGDWDAVRNDLFGEHFTALGLLSLIPSEWTVADIGCGTGNLAELLCPNVERVIAVDQSETMLDAARRRLGPDGRDADNIEFRVGEVTGMPLADASVDAVCLSLLLHHVDEPAAALVEARRVLRGDLGGGVVLVIEMTAHGRTEYRHQMGHKHLGFPDEQLRGLLAGAGFERIRLVHLPADTQTKGPGLVAAVGHIPRI